jgi:hypothetical protein
MTDLEGRSLLGSEIPKAKGGLGYRVIAYLSICLVSLLIFNISGDVRESYGPEIREKLEAWR